MKRLAPLALAAALAMPAQALAWGSAGHRMVGVEALKALPPGMPAFLTSKKVAVEVGELSREPDRTKGAGRLHDTMREGDHFVDLDDDGKVVGGVALYPMPETRAAYEKALQAAGHDGWYAGWLQYSLVDQVQQLAKEFGYWRAVYAAERNPAWRKQRAWFKADRLRREALILRTLGYLGHFAGDGAQPLHVSIHYNGWGEFPNPRGFTQEKIHSRVDGLPFGRVDPAAVAARMTPYKPCGCPIEQRVTGYLSTSLTQLVPLYELEKAGGLAAGDPRGTDFATIRLAAGASELRDLIGEAWTLSDTATVGWRPVSLADVEAGKVNPYEALLGVD